MATTTTTLLPGPSFGPDVDVYLNDALTADLVVRTIRASYVRPWQAELFWPGRHDDPPEVSLWDELRIEDDGGAVRFDGFITEIQPGGVDSEGVRYTASDRRFILENEPVRINGRGYYLWNRRGYTCNTGRGGEDSPGRDGGKWTAGEIIIDILEHALGLPAAGSDIPGHHSDDCCVPDPYLDATVIAGYDAAAILALNSVVGEVSINGTSIAFAITELLALNGGFYGWYIDPETGHLVVQDLDALPTSNLQAGRLGHWQDEAGTDFVLLGNELEWSLDGVCTTLVVQGQDRTVEVRPGNIEGSGNPAMNGGGQLERIAAPWHGWPSAWRALCQPYRLTTGKEIDAANLYTPPAGWANATKLPRVYRGTAAGPKTAYVPASGVFPVWMLPTGIIGFYENPSLSVGERLWGWYWARQPFTVTAGPDGDAYHWYGYECTRWIYDASFRSVSSWPTAGTSDDAVAMALLAERLLRIFRDVRRQGTLRCDRVDFDVYNLDRRYNVRNLGPEHLGCPAGSTSEAPTTTQMGGYADPTAWRSLAINAVDVLYDFTQDAVEITVANTFWMLEEYSAIKQRLEMNLFAQRELALSQDILDCQVHTPAVGDDQSTIEPVTTEAPITTTTTTPEPGTTTTPEPGTTTTGEPGPTTTGEPGPTTTGEPGPTTGGPGPTSSTTSPEPGSTTSTTTGAPGCPEDCWDCAAVYGVVLDDLYCDWREPCGVVYMDRVETDPCSWISGEIAEPYQGVCGGALYCTQDGEDYYWTLIIAHWAAAGECIYRRPATLGSCPAGVYTLYSSGLCGDCPAQVEVVAI